MRLLYLFMIPLVVGLMPQSALAQPTVDIDMPEENLINDILLGAGVLATNIQLVGVPQQTGYLTGAIDTGLPIDGGIVLSSGYASNMLCSENGGFFTGVAGNNDLLSVAQSVPGLIGANFNVSSVHDVCIISFDFVATGDSLFFNYVFGSVEYNTYINTQFNDVFAFFLAGPGISGPFSSPPGFPDGSTNLAVLPGTNPPLPVTISSIHSGTNNLAPLNGEFHISNTSPQVPFGETDPDICMNGWTVVLPVEEQLICGETYHIQLAIADGGDTALDSWVILEEGSFESNSVVEVDLFIDVGQPGVETLYEGCGTAFLTFTRPPESNLDLEEMIIIDYGGEAINGEDYTLLPDTIIFEPGVESITFEIIAFEDGIEEGLETVEFEILNLAACNGTGLTSYFTFFIDDDPDPLVVEGYTVEMCEGAEVTLEPIITGGYGNFIYEWSTNETTPTITVSPETDTAYNIMVSDTCGMPSDDADIFVEILQLPVLEVNITNGDLNLNCNESVLVSATAEGGIPPYTWSWSNQNGESLGSSGTTLFYNTQQAASQIIATATDGCGFIISDTINVNLNVPPMDVDIPEEITSLCLEEFTISPVVAGGQAPYSYTWLQDGNFLSWSQNYSSALQADETFTFQVTDACGQTQQFPVDVVIESPPVAITLPESVEGPCTETFELNPEIEGGSGGFEYAWFANGEPLSESLNTTWQSFDDAVLEFTVVDQCNASDEFAVNVFIVNPPVVLDIGEDIFASCLDNTVIDVDVVEGSGQYEYEWFVADTAFATTEDIVVQSFVTIPVGVQVTDGCGSVDYDELMYFIPDDPLVLELHPDTAICAGTSISLTAFAEGGEDGFFYQWETLGAGPEQYITPYQSATYPVTATDICGASISGEIFVEVQFLFSDFTVSSLSNENQYQFFANPAPSCPGCEYLWDFGDGTFSDEENPIHTFDGLSDYTVSLQVTNAIGCTNTAYTLIQGPIILYVPNAFTPNNDGINDVFQVKGNGIMRFNIKIFNRWGEKVYESDDIDEFWDGSHAGGEYYVPNDIYTYVIEVKGFDTDAIERVGHISVMR